MSFWVLFVIGIKAHLENTLLLALNAGVSCQYLWTFPGSSGFLSAWGKLELFEKMGPQLRNLTVWPVQQFLINDWCRRGWAYGPECRESKLHPEEPAGKQHSSLASVPAPDFLSPDLRVGRINKPFPPQVFLVMVSYHSNGNPKTGITHTDLDCLLWGQASKMAPWRGPCSSCRSARVELTACMLVVWSFCLFM